MNLKHLLKEPFELPDRILKVLEENSEFVSFLKNQEIIRPGDTDVDFYIIASGLARIYHRPEGEDGRDEKPAFRREGQHCRLTHQFHAWLPGRYGHCGRNEAHGI